MTSKKVFIIVRVYQNSLEQDLTAQAESFQARVREKDREIKKFKEDLKALEKRHQKQTELLTSEKQQHKGSLERIGKLTEQITKLEKEKQTLAEKVEKMPGEFPKDDEKPQGTEKDKSDLAEFIEWTKEYKEFEKVDWNYYLSRENWENDFRNWNKLRTDRISLLDKWKETKSNQQSKEQNK